MIGHPCWFITVFLFAGCAVLDRTEVRGYSEILAWQLGSILNDVRELTLREEAERPREIAEYIAAQMHGIQPVFGDSLIFSLPGSRRIIRKTELGNIRESGQMYWAFPQSGTGEYTITTLSSSSLPKEGAAALIPQQELTSDRIHEFIRQGAKVILSVGPVYQQLASEAVMDALVISIQTEVLASVTGLPLDSIVTGELPDEYILPDPLHAKVEIENCMSPLNVMGFIAGQDPRYASELIVVAADPLWIPPSGGFSSWIPTAILIELVRKYSEGSARMAFPKQSILFVAGTGAALHVIFEYPVWPQQYIKAIITLGRHGNGFMQQGSIPLIAAPIFAGKEPEDLEAWLTQYLKNLDTMLHTMHERE